MSHVAAELLKGVVQPAAAGLHFNGYFVFPKEVHVIAFPIGHGYGLFKFAHPVVVPENLQEFNDEALPLGFFAEGPLPGFGKGERPGLDFLWAQPRLINHVLFYSY
jgi:hypothetical protein